MEGDDMTEEELQIIVDLHMSADDRATYQRQVTESTVVILNHVATVVTLPDDELRRRIELLEKVTEDAHVTLVGAIVLYYARREMARRTKEATNDRT